MANATSEGIDVTVTGNDTRSTQHLTWEMDDYFSAESTKCGGLHFQQNQLDMRMITPAVGDACAAFNALYQANEGYRAILE